MKAINKDDELHSENRIKKKMEHKTLIHLCFDTEGNSSHRKSFAEVVKNNQSIERPNQCENHESIPLKPIPSPKIIGGNAVVEIDDKAYKRGVEHLRFNVLG